MDAIRRITESRPQIGVSNERYEAHFVWCLIVSNPWNSRTHPQAVTEKRTPLQAESLVAPRMAESLDCRRHVTRETTRNLHHNNVCISLTHRIHVPGSSILANGGGTADSAAEIATNHLFKLEIPALWMRSWYLNVILCESWV